MACTITSGCSHDQKGARNRNRKRETRMKGWVGGWMEMEKRGRVREKDRDTSTMSGRGWKVHERVIEGICLSFVSDFQRSQTSQGQRNAKVKLLCCLHVREERAPGPNLSQLDHPLTVSCQVRPGSRSGTAEKNGACPENSEDDVRPA